MCNATARKHLPKLDAKRKPPPIGAGELVAPGAANWVGAVECGTGVSFSLATMLKLPAEAGDITGDSGLSQGHFVADFRHQPRTGELICDNFPYILMG